MTATSSPPEFDPYSDAYFEDPYAMYARLRDEAPISYNEKYNFYALSRYADVVAGHRDWERLSSAHGLDPYMMSLPVEQIAGFRSMIMMDPPDHDRFRGLVNRVFTPRAVGALEPMVREVITGYLDQIGSDDFDAVQQFSAPFPVEIISRMLGVPAEDRQQIRHWLDIGLTREKGRMEPPEAANQAHMDSGIYFYELVQEKRTNPGDDMLSRLTQVTVDRGDGTETGLDDAEIAGFATLLGGAGAETVTKLVGNAFVLFARNPDQWEKVRSDPEMIPLAVEETLRILPPSQYQGRFTHEDFECESGVVPAGFPVLMLTGAATRDPRQFERPDEFIIERPPSVAVGFGHGVHSCLGAALARMESRIAFEEMRRRWRSWEIDDAALRRVHMSNVAGYSNVPVRAVPA